MPNPLKRRLLPAASSTLAVALVAGVLAGPAAAAETANAKFDLDRLAYTSLMRAAAIETYADVPRNIVQDGGLALVDLRKDALEATARCIVQGAGYYLGEEIEQGIIKGGAAPVAEGQTAQDASPYENPTLSQKIRPEVGAIEGDSATEVDPAFPAAGNGPKWTGACTDDFFGGTATGDNINAQGFRFAGSTVTSQINKANGTQTSTGRAYITGIDAAFDTMESLMQVTHVPNKEPKVDFRLSFFNSEPGMSNFSDEGFTFFGSAVPASDFVATFNEQAKAFAAMYPAGPAGLQILAPEVGINQDSLEYQITAPAATGNFGFDSQKGTIGQNFGARFASVTWTGVNVIVE